MATSQDMRAFQQLLGILPEARPTHSEQLERVVLTRHVTTYLRRQAALHAPSRTGLLFGCTRDDTLKVTLAMNAALPSVPFRPEQLTVNAAHLLGASEALGLAYGGRIDWCGVWVIPSGGLFGPATQDAPLVRQAEERGYIDDRAVLLTAGFEEGTLMARAYLGLRLADPLDLPVEFGV